MTEKEKMIRGDWYVSLGEELFNDRQNASGIIFEYNSLHPREVEKRMDLLRSLFGESPKEFYIENNLLDVHMDTIFTGVKIHMQTLIALY